MNLSHTVIQEFPKVDFCEIVSSSNIDSFKEDLKKFNIFEWVFWMLKNSQELKHSQVRLINNELLLVQTISEDEHLIILNQSENDLQLINFINTQTTPPDEIDTNQKPVTTSPKPPEANSESRLNEALEVYKKLLPLETEIKQNFRRYFIHHKPVDKVGGDFYWCKQLMDCYYFALINCSGQGPVATMTAMICHSLLNQAATGLDEDNISEFVEVFYDTMDGYNKTSKNIMDYTIDAKIGIYCFNFRKKKLQYVTTGVSSIIQNKDMTLEVLEAPPTGEVKINNYFIDKLVLDTSAIKKIYLFTEGVSKQFHSQDVSQGIENLRQVIQEEKKFGKDHYISAFERNRKLIPQKEDITLIGLAL